MNSAIRKRTLWLGAISALLVLLIVAPPALAQQNKYQFSTRNQKKMVKIFEFLRLEGTDEEEAEAKAEAKDLLLGINLKRARPYGKARVLCTLGAVEVQEGNNEQALDYLEQCVEVDALPPEDQLRNLFMVGQLQTMLERYDDAIVTLEKWIAQVETPAPSSYYTLAVTYYQAGRPEDSLAPAKKAVELSVDTPRESWYRLLLSLYLSSSDYDEALALLDDIIIAYPKKDYWSQMAAIYSQKDDMGKSLAVQQLAKGEGFISESRDLLRVAQMLMVQGLPHRGAEVMKTGLDDGSIEPTRQAFQTYSDTLLQSREWALAVDPLGKAAEMEENGRLFVRLAQVNIQLGRWGDARNALDDAFDKGDLSDEGQAHILYGIAAFNDKKWNSATRAFSRAERFDGTRETAGKWKAYVGREKARLGVTD
jgi:tetratricopeptide (TPR) repeat protein